MKYFYVFFIQFESIYDPLLKIIVFGFHELLYYPPGLSPAYKSKLITYIAF